MECNCGHDHGKITQADFNKAVKRFMSGLGENLDIDEEYVKIQNKESKLSKMQRDTIVALVEYKREHFK